MALLRIKPQGFLIHRAIQSSTGWTVFHSFVMETFFFLCAKEGRG